MEWIKVRQMRNQDFMNRFNELRTNTGFTQEEFSNFVGIGRSTIADYSSGARMPTGQNLKQIAEKCGVSADWLLGLTDHRTPKTDLRAVCEYTGLDEKTVTLLRQYPFFSHLLSLFVPKVKIEELMARIHNLVILSAAETNQAQLAFDFDVAEGEAVEITPLNITVFCDWLLERCQDMLKMDCAESDAIWDYVDESAHHIDAVSNDLLAKAINMSQWNDDDFANWCDGLREYRNGGQDDGEDSGAFEGDYEGLSYKEYVELFGDELNGIH